MNENQTYYFTFAASHPLGDNWIEVSAPNAQLAREVVMAQFGIWWSRQYEDADFKPEYFPGGRIGGVLEAI